MGIDVLLIGLAVQNTGFSIVRVAGKDHWAAWNSFHRKGRHSGLPRYGHRVCLSDPSAIQGQRGL